jgi:hypothetical protein
VDGTPSTSGLLDAPVATSVDLAALTSVTRRASVARLLRIGYVAARRLGPVVLARPFVRDDERRRGQLGRALSIAVTDLGVTFVKLGQLLASSPSIAGQTLADAMRGVLDDGPPVPFDEVRRIVEADLGRPLEQVFRSFDEVPFAAASLAVVHRGQLLDGTDVAVKVLRPASARLVATDLSLVRPFVRGLARLVPVGVFPAVPPTIEGLAVQLSEELDLRNEGDVMDWFAQMTELIGAAGVLVPTTVRAASGERVLTMEYIHGSKVDDLEAIAHGSIDARAAIEALIESWFALALCTGTFHGDMHAGNLLLTPDGQVALLDWGIVGRLPAASQFFFRRSLEGALGDESAWPDVCDHMLQSMPPELLASVVISPYDLLAKIRAQTLMIMTSPFSELDLMMLTPGAPVLEGAPEMPSSLRGWLRVIRTERRRIREGGASMMDSAPPHGEMLLIKQLVFFERYGKLFLGDRPLIFDPAVYRTLLDLSTPMATGLASPPTS